MNGRERREVALLVEDNRADIFLGLCQVEEQRADAMLNGV